MIIRGVVQNGGMTFGRDGREVMVRILIDEGVDVELQPSRLRGREAVLVLLPIQLPAAVMPALGGDHPASMVDDGMTDPAATVAESSNG